MSKKTVVSIVENLLMVLLLFAMLVQCVWYISLAQNKGDGSLPEFPESEVQLLTEGKLDLNETVKSLVTPYFAGVISENGMYGGTYNDALAYEIFRNFARVLENAPGGTAKKVVYSDTQKKYEYLENLYNGTKNCYYVKLNNGVEFSVLCQLMSDTYTEIPENPGFAVKDMFLISGASGEASITAVDNDGNVLKIYPSKNIPFNKEYLESYNNTEKDEFEFVLAEDNVSADKNCYFPAFKYSLKYNTVLRTPFSERFDIDAEGADLRDFVSIFGMNEDNTRFYKRNSDGAMICVEDTTSFEITQNGGFVFIPEAQGGNLGAFLSIGADSGYGFFEYAGAAQEIAVSLNEKLSGCCGRLSLEDIVYNDGECRFYYSYTVNGVPVEEEGEYALELRFSRDSLIYAKGKIEVLVFDQEAVTDIPQKTAYVLMERNNGTVLYFGPEYTFGDDPQDSSRALMRWTVEYDTGDGGLQE